MAPNDNGGNSRASSPVRGKPPKPTVAENTIDVTRCPLVTVCIMTYNQVEMVKDCLDSVLQQDTNFEFEVIVGDDGSSDGTQSVLMDYAAQQVPGKVRVLLSPRNMGPTHNYLRTHAQARGRYIACLDGDDLALPGKLQAQVDVLESHREVNVVTHEMLIQSPDGEVRRGETRLRRVQPESGFTIRHFLARGHLGAHSSEMYRAEYRVTEPLPGGELMDIYTLGSHLGDGKAIHIPQPLGLYRSGVGVLTSNFAHYRRIGVESLEVLGGRHPQYRAEVCAALLAALENDVRAGRGLHPTLGAVARFWSFRAPSIYWRVRTFRRLKGD